MLIDLQAKQTATKVAKPQPSRWMVLVKSVRTQLWKRRTYPTYESALKAFGKFPSRFYSQRQLRAIYPKAK